MLNNIKSSFLYHLLLSFLDEGAKLNIIKINKNLQNRAEITKAHYRIFSGKYFVDGGNNIRKIFNGNNNALIFEGEYVKGKKNGKAKEYNDYGSIIYEGEFLNGKRHGKGKEYDNSVDRLIFEGEFKNGKRWNGKGYDKDGYVVYELKEGKGYVREFYSDRLLFEGEYLNGDKNGKGIEYNRLYSNVEFEGEYLNGKKNGKGKEYFGNYLVYDGEYLNGKKWNGKIKSNDINVKYELINGKGTFIEFFATITSKIRYEGEFLNGEKNGKGKEYISGSLIFEGEYLNGKRHGKGKEYHGILKGMKFEGTYLYGHRLKGKEYDYGGKLIFEGEYLYDLKWTGKEYDENGKVLNEYKNGAGFITEIEKDYRTMDVIKFVGEYKNGMKNGKGKEYCNDKLMFEGEYLNGKRSGKGKEYDYNGNLLFEGEYLDDKKWTGKVKEFSQGTLAFEGEYLKGKKWNGRRYDFRGNFKSEMKDGSGVGEEYHSKEYGPSKRICFSGEYLNGERNGEGREYDYDFGVIFDGKFLNGKRNGHGKVYDKYYHSSILKYEGEFLDGKKNGKMKKFFGNDTVEFEGEFLKDRKWNGKGYDKNGNVVYEIKDGCGTMREYDILDNLIFEGQIMDGLRHWKGKEYQKEQLIYEGDFKYGKRSGYGKEYENGKLVFEGRFLNGVRHGKGKEYDDKGQVIYEGIYASNKKLQIMEFIDGKLKIDYHYMLSRE